MSETSEPAAAGSRVTNLELFFDLVFVFTVTQLTGMQAHDLTWTGFWHVTVLLGLIFWMYGGYAWLTNAVPARGMRRRALLIGGMCAYLVMALAVPTTFDGDGFTFGLAWFVIVGIHTFLFVQAPSDLTAAAMRWFAPYNLGRAIAVVVSGAIGGTVQDVAFPLAVAFVWSSRFVHRPDKFEIAPVHFVERHGLVVIVAIGESVVAVGIGAADLPITGELIAVAVVGLLVSTGLWWAYFGDDDDARAERALGATPATRRARVALRAFGDAHAVMLLGIVLVAVGLKTVVAQPGDPLGTPAALTLAGGVALFLVGNAYFRRVLDLGNAVWRAGCAAAVMLAVPVATELNAVSGLVVVAVVLTAGLAYEHVGAASRLSRRA